MIKVTLDAALLVFTLLLAGLIFTIKYIEYIILLVVILYLVYNIKLETIQEVIKLLTQ